MAHEPRAPRALTSALRRRALYDTAHVPLRLLTRSTTMFHEQRHASDTAQRAGPILAQPVFDLLLVHVDSVRRTGVGTRVGLGVGWIRSRWGSVLRAVSTLCALRAPLPEGQGTTGFGPFGDVEVGGTPRTRSRRCGHAATQRLDCCTAT
eukprot:7379761-Prymnesium_polylepis.1